MKFLMHFYLLLLVQGAYAEPRGRRRRLDDDECPHGLVLPSGGCLSFPTPAPSTAPSNSPSTSAALSGFRAFDSWSLAELSYFDKKELNTASAADRKGGGKHQRWMMSMGKGKGQTIVKPDFCVICSKSTGSLLKSLTLKYVSQGQDSTYQEGQKATCDEGRYPKRTTISVIKIDGGGKGNRKLGKYVTRDGDDDDDDDDDGSEDTTKIEVEEGTVFTINGPFGADTLFTFGDRSSCTIQTSCSLPLVSGDVIGPFLVIGGTVKAKNDGTENTCELDLSTSSPVQSAPSRFPTRSPTKAPTKTSTPLQTRAPSQKPAPSPTNVPSPKPTNAPSPKPTPNPTNAPTPNPTIAPTPNPTFAPTPNPTIAPTLNSTFAPTRAPTPLPTSQPTPNPTVPPTPRPNVSPSNLPTFVSSDTPSIVPSIITRAVPSTAPSVDLSGLPSMQPSNGPSNDPSTFPTLHPSANPSSPSTNPTIGSSDPTPTMSPPTSPSANPSTSPSTNGTTNSSGTNEWVQIGARILGESAGDASGSSVALSSDGIVLAIGAPSNNGANGADSGHVRVYVWTGSSWTQRGSDIDGEAAGDQSGRSVSLSSDGTVLAIGAPGNDGNGSDSGQVRVYVWTGSVWSRRGSDINGEAVLDALGLTVSLSSDGTILAAGAPGNDGVNGSDSGHVRVYKWTGSVWSQLGSDIDGEAAGDQSGRSVSLSSNGTILAIGAPGNDVNGSNSGHVRVHQWTGSAWSRLSDDIDGEAAADQSGRSVSLSSDGTVLAVGAWLNDGNGSDSGHVRVYEWSGSAWSQLGDDINGEAAGDQSGSSVSLSSDGTALAVGAPFNGGSGGGASGHVRVFEWTGSVWSQVGNDIDGQSVLANAGSSVSMSSDGGIVAIGAEGDDGNGTNSGSTQVYQYNGY